MKNTMNQATPMATQLPEEFNELINEFFYYASANEYEKMLWNVFEAALVSSEKEHATPVTEMSFIYRHCSTFISKLELEFAKYKTQQES